jgi:hypothetical protein
MAELLGTIGLTENRCSDGVTDIGGGRVEGL